MAVTWCDFSLRLRFSLCAAIPHMCCVRYHATLFDQGRQDRRDGGLKRVGQAVFAGMTVSEGHSPGRDLALLAGCRDVVFGVGTFAWLGAYIATGGGVRPTDGKVPPSPRRLVWSNGWSNSWSNSWSNR